MALIGQSRTDYRAHTSAEARFWPRCAGESPENVSSCAVCETANGGVAELETENADMQATPPFHRGEYP